MQEFHDPVLWEAYRSATPFEQGLAELDGATDPVLIARRVELLILTCQPEQMDAAGHLLPEVDDRLRDGLTALLYAVRRVWPRVAEVAQAYVQRPGHEDPLILEGALMVYSNGAMAARELKQPLEAATLMGRALSLVDTLNLPARWVQNYSELERGRTLDGKGNPERIRGIRARATNPRQWRVGTYYIAESLGSYGQYREALWELRGMTDDRAVGMRAFYAALLGESFDDPGGTDDWLRLARAIQTWQRGEYAVGDLHMGSEPQASYARILTAGAMLTGPTPRRALGLPRPGPADQRLYRVLVLLGLLERGIPVQAAPLLIDEWRDALRTIQDREAVFRVAQMHAGTPMLLLSLLPDAPSELRAWQHHSLILAGTVLRQAGREWPGAGRVGGVLIADAAGMPYDELKGGEPGRWARNIRIALTESGQRTYLNPGGALRAARMLVEACPDDPHVRTLPDAVCALMTEDARLLCTPKDGEVNEC